ncbi:putative PurR-regulated permease PerM [Cyclonatronum proteinivorum]|uniref:Putative PurR-regulated permease PerM n=2 Tax=Cyclonatronum proteinivorum TaxID=1457365 RepID=A0A345UGU6_9BACT|nr:putative PurR-regulated permease PerM [Cyclonatronum proteinivorum]
MLSLVVFGMVVAKSVLIPLFFAVFFAVLLSPLCGRLEDWHVPRVLSALLSLFLGIGLVVVTGIFMYTQIVGLAADAGLVEERLRSLLEDFEDLAGEYVDLDMSAFISTIPQNVISYVTDNVESLSRGVLSAASTLTGVFIIPVYVVLFLLFRDFLKEFMIRAFSNGDEARMQRLIDKVKSVVQNYILGMLIVICILAVLNSTMLWVLGVRHALFFGVFAAMLNIIPFVGPLLGSILPILYALLTMDSLLIPLLVLLGFYVIQLFESNLFTPSIVGRQVSLNPLVTLIAIFVGAQIWGLVGMILFIPASAVLKVIFDEFDSLKPYGFLLGKADLRHKKGKSKLALKVQDMSERISDKASEMISSNKAESEKESAQPSKQKTDSVS